MIVGRDLAGTDCRAILAVNESGYFGSLDGLQAALLVLSLLALVLIPVIQWRLTSLHLEAGGGAAQCYGAYPRR